MEGSAPPNKSKILAIIPRFVVDEVTAKFEAEVVRGTKAAAEEAAAKTPSRTGREVNFMVCFSLCSIAKVVSIRLSNILNRRRVSIGSQSMTKSC